MNWFTLTLVFHVLRLNLCVALSQVCSDHQFLSAGVCVNCTVCKQPGKNVVLRPCSSHEDTICGSVSNIHINLAGIKNSEYEDDITNRYLTVNTKNNLSKKTIAATPKELSKPLKPILAAVDSLNATYSYYDDEDANEDDLDYEYEDDSTSTSATKSNEPTWEQFRKEYHVNGWDSERSKEFKDSNFSHFPNSDKVSVTNLDTPFKKIKNVKKFKLKESNTNVEINDHFLTIADTQFKVGDEKPDNGRRLELPHPQIVDEKSFVDSMEKNRKGSTFFSSGEKQTDREYANEMAKLLNETSSVLNENNPTNDTTTTPPFNSTKQNSPNANVDDYDLLKNMLDHDNNDDDDDEDDDDEDEDEDEDDEDDNEDGVSDEDDPLFNNFGSSNSSDRNDGAEASDYDMDDDNNDYISGNEKTDFDKEDDNDLQENDLYEDKTYMHIPGLTSNDVIAEPFVSTANWQILILVAAMSACLLFFIVVSAYICIYMRKRTYYKTTFVPDIEDLSSRVNLIQHATLEANDSNNMRNYNSHLRSVKSNNEKLPKVHSRSE